jgi:hypothetical protein
MLQTYNIKNLVIAMPGSGKTYYTRKMNRDLPRNVRPVIDFDYSGPRVSGAEMPPDMLAAQTQLINSFTNIPCVHTVMCHPDAVDWDVLNRDKYRIVFVLTNDIDTLQRLVDRVNKRDGRCTFVEDYSKFAETWWKRNIRLANELVAKGFKVSILEMAGNQNLCDVYDHAKFDEGGYLMAVGQHAFFPPDADCTDVRDYTSSRDNNHKRLVSFLMNELAKAIVFRGTIHDADKGERKHDCSYHHTTARHHFNHSGAHVAKVNLVDLVENMCDTIATSVEKGFWDPPKQSGEWYESVIRTTMDRLQSLIGGSEKHECHWSSESKFYPTVNCISEDK